MLNTEFPQKPTELTFPENRETFRQLLQEAIPTKITNRRFILSLVEMDLRHFDHPIFNSPDEVDKLMAYVLPFDLETLAATWNSALSDNDYEYSYLAKKLVLDAENEKMLFLKFNFARKKVSSFLVKAAQEGLLLRNDAQEAGHWGVIMKQARDILVVANLGLVFSMGRRYGIFQGGDPQELIAEGFGAVMRSVDGFNLERGFKFSTYACRSVIQSMNRAKAKNAKRLQRENPSSMDITPESKIDPGRFDVEEDIDDLRFVLEQNRANLTENERLVIKGRFFDEQKLHEVGTNLNLTKERVRQIQNKAIRKLQGAMLN